MPTIAIFGSSDCKENSEEYKSAEALGKYLSEKGYNIMTGGYLGVMEAGLKGASHTNVKRIGVVSEFFKDREPNKYATEVVKVKDYCDRLHYMINNADAYIIFPGGTGTLLELASVWAFLERGIIKNKYILCFGEQWKEVLEVMAFFSEKSLDSMSLINHSSNVEEAISMIENFCKCL